MNNVSYRWSINYRLEVARKKSNIKDILLRAQNTFSICLNLEIFMLGEISFRMNVLPTSYRL